MSNGRRSFLRTVGSLLLTGTGVGHWLRFEAEDLEIVRRQIPLRGLHRPLRLVQLSDFHFSPVVRPAFLEDVVRTCLDERPDVICLTGDFTTDGIKNWEPLRALLTPLAAAAPTYAVAGNHDGAPGAPDGLYRATARTVRGAGIRILENENERVPVADERLQLVGTADLWQGPFDPREAFRGARAELPTVLLTHNPDARLAVEPFPWDLSLCGHTHGGQINLPWLHGRFAPIRDRRFLAGTYPLGDRHLHVNRGIGSIGGIRFGARPELTVFELLPAS